MKRFSLRTTKKLLFPLVLLLIAGCAAQMHTSQMADVKESVNSSEFNLNWLEDKVYTGDKNFRSNVDPVHLLELGVLYPLVSEFEKSNEVLELAFEKYTAREERARINARDTTKDTIDILFGEGSGDYELSQFEKVYIHNIKTMNYLMMGKPESARVEAQRAINRHQMIRDYAAFELAQLKKGKKEVKKDAKKTLSNQAEWETIQGKSGFESNIRQFTEKASLSAGQKQAISHMRNAYENCYTYLLSALTLGLNDELENIRPHLKNADALTDNRYVKQLFNDYQNDSNTITSKVNVYIFAKEDFAPTKENLNYSFLNPISDTVTQFSLARINPTQASILSIELLDSKSRIIGKMEPLADLDLLSLKQYDKDLPKNVSKAIMRLVSQSIRDKAAIDQAKDTRVSFLYKVGLSVLNMTTSFADIRAWTMVPKKISFYCGQINEAQINMRIKDVSGQVIDRREISISPGKVNIVSVRCSKNNTFVNHQVFGSSTPMEGLRVIWKQVNIRSGPSSSHVVIDKAKLNDRFKPLKTVGNWHCVKLPSGKIGYIFHKAVIPAK